MSLTGTVWVGEIHSPPTNTRNARTRMAPTLVWRVCLPYGWAADDPVGLKHAIGRGLLSYVAFVYVPSPYKASPHQK
jgi:hypothetical protein